MYNTLSNELNKEERLTLTYKKVVVEGLARGLLVVKPKMKILKLKQSKGRTLVLYKQNNTD